MQGITFNDQGIKGIESGAKCMFREPLNELEMRHYNSWLKEDCFSKYQVGEVVYVKEEFYETEKAYWYERDIVKYDIDTLHYSKKAASEMQEHQARFFLKIKSIKVERLQDISEEDCIKEGMYKKECIDWGNRGGEYPPMPTQDYAFTVNGKDGFLNAIDCFKDDIWNKIYGKGAEYLDEDGEVQARDGTLDWDSNPHVFVYELERVDN